MTPLFWISLTWVLATTAVGRLPVAQRIIPGILLIVTAVPIILSIGFQIGWLMALLALVALVSSFPTFLRLIVARYRGEKVQIDANILRYLVVPGEI